MKQNRHYTSMHCATLGPVMLVNRKFDISRNLSTFPSQLHWKASESFVTQCCRHRGGFGGLSPSERELQDPQIRIWSTI